MSCNHHTGHDNVTICWIALMTHGTKNPDISAEELSPDPAFKIRNARTDPLIHQPIHRSILSSIHSFIHPALCPSNPLPEVAACRSNPATALQC